MAEGTLDASSFKTTAQRGQEEQVYDEIDLHDEPAAYFDPAEELQGTKRDFCYRCHKPGGVCICSRFADKVQNQIGVTILQDQKEKYHPLGSARIALLGLANVQVIVVPRGAAKLGLPPKVPGSKRSICGRVGRKGRHPKVPNLPQMEGGEGETQRAQLEHNKLLGASPVDTDQACVLGNVPRDWDSVERISSGNAVPEFFPSQEVLVVNEVLDDLDALTGFNSVGRLEDDGRQEVANWQSPLQIDCQLAVEESGGDLVLATADSAREQVSVLGPPMLSTRTGHERQNVTDSSSTARAEGEIRESLRLGLYDGKPCEGHCEEVTQSGRSQSEGPFLQEQIGTSQPAGSSCRKARVDKHMSGCGVSSPTDSDTANIGVSSGGACASWKMVPDSGPFEVPLAKEVPWWMSLPPGTALLYPSEHATDLVLPNFGRISEPSVDSAAQASATPKFANLGADGLESEGQMKSQDRAGMERWNCKDQPRPRHLIVIDGTWGKAKRIYRQNVWLQRLPHLRLPPCEPSHYGFIRRQPKVEFLSTIESIVYALRALEPETCGLSSLLDVFDSMVRDQVQCMGPAALSAQARKSAIPGQKSSKEFDCSPPSSGHNRRSLYHGHGKRERRKAAHQLAHAVPDGIAIISVE